MKGYAAMRVLALLLAPLALAACADSTPDDATASSAPDGVMATTNATVEPVPTETVTTTPSAGAKPPASDTPMPGNSTPIPADAPPSACGANTAAKFVGKIATPDVRAQVIDAVGHNRIRWIGPDTVVTMDFSEGRVTIAYDDAMTITAVTCG
jgi:hypothetical protein